MTSDDPDLDALYQGPLSEFITSRNALAKRLKRADLKALEKPSVPAWAVNQVYWRERPVFDALLDAARRLRSEHAKVLSGQQADLKGAEAVHRERLREAVERACAILTDANQAVTAATMTAIQETLEALPGNEPVGRLVRPLKPQGFEVLSALPITPVMRVVEKPPPATRSATPETADAARAPGSTASPTESALARERERREAEEHERRRLQHEAEATLKAAEAAMLEAEERVKLAEKTLGEARVHRDHTVREYQRARLRARQ